MNMISNANSGLPRRSARGAYAISAILLLGLSVLAFTSASSAGAAASLNLVDVSIQTTRSFPYQYTLTAYNTSGYQVASYNGIFPEAALALPSGTYLITASAFYQQNNECTYCPLMAKSASETGPALPSVYVPPYSEYGYAVESVSGPIQVTIVTQNSTAGSVVQIPVHVTFANGTAAVGAYVSASMVGTSYEYSPSWNMSGQTGTNGNVTLILPKGPVQVSASLSVPVQLPKNVTTVTVVVGGQKVNVTVYWEPNYVNLSGQTLILPPQMGASIALQVQQSYPFPIVYSGTGAIQGNPGVPQGGVTTVTTIYGVTTSGQKAVQSPQTNRIPAFSPSNSQLSPSSLQAPAPSLGFGTVEALMAVVAAAAAVGVGVSLLLRRQGIEGTRP